jgi:hypothetical protein
MGIWLASRHPQLKPHSGFHVTAEDVCDDKGCEEPTIHVMFNNATCNPECITVPETTEMQLAELHRRLAPSISLCCKWDVALILGSAEPESIAIIA